MTNPSMRDTTQTLDALPIPAVLVDPDGRIVASNRLLDELAANTDGPAFRTWSELMSACGVSALLARSALLTRRTPLEMQLDVDGDTQRCEVIAAPYCHDLRVVLFWPTRQPEEATRPREIERLEPVQSVALHLSNTLNNVLAVIAGHLEAAGTPGVDVSAELGSALVAVEKAARTVRGVQRIVRPLPTHRRPLDPATVVQSAVRAVRDTLPATALLNVEFDHGDWMIFGDEQQLVDAVISVLNNARDAIGNRGSITVRTRQHSAEEDDQRPAGLPPTSFVSIEVTDDGVGIPNQIRSRVFEPFFSTKGQPGLGLTGVYQVLKQHAGVVHVDKHFDQGTAIRLFVPHAVGVTAPEAETSPPVDPVAGGTVLVVDDDASIRRVLAKTLERAGHTVLLAAGGHQALSLLRSHALDIDLVVLDVIMPDLSGWTVLGEIRKRVDPPRVIVQSGFMTEVDSEAASLADAFLRKPYELEQFLETVRSVLGSSDPPRGATA